MTYNQQLNKILNSIDKKTTKRQAHNLEIKLHKLIAKAKSDEYMGRCACHGVKEDKIFKKLKRVVAEFESGTD